jgi:4-amino-4-deoxy-L-arabinose transferase-like glycosyltransferase
MGASLLLLGLALLAGTAGLGAAALRLPSLVSFALAAYVLACAEVVLVTEVLSPPRWATATGYLVAEAVLLACAAVLWSRRGRPRPRLPRVALGAAVRSHPVLAALLAVVVAGFCYELFVVLATPPNNGDALSYHLSRAAAWFQEGGLHFIEEAHTERQNEFPPNAEIGFLYTFALLGRDGAAALPQVAAQAAVVLAVAGLARRLGAGRPAALYAGLLTACLTEVALQSVTTKNDLVAASFVAAAAYFLGGRTTAELALAGLAVGLAVGTKLTAFLALPTLALLALVWFPRRRAAVAALAAVCAFPLVAGWIFVQNARETGDPLGNRYEQTIFRPDVTLAGTASTLARIGFQLVDLSGFRVRTSLLEPVSSAGEAVFDVLHIPPNPPESAGFPFDFTVNVVAHEDHSFFGPLGILLVVPIGVACAVAWARRRATAAHAVLALSLPLYALLLALVFRFSDEGRYLVTPVALTMPLVAVLYRRRVLASAVAVLAALTLFFAHAYNASRPTGLAGTTAIWNMSRAEGMGLFVPGLPELVTAVDQAVPEDARLGTVLAFTDADYPYYGERLRRRLVEVPPEDPLRGADAIGVRWVVLGRGKQVVPAAGWARVARTEVGSLYRRS